MLVYLSFMYIPYMKIQRMRQKIDVYAFTIVNHDLSLRRPLFVHHRNVLNQVLYKTFKRTRFADLALSGCVKGLPKQANRSNSQLLVVKHFESLRQNDPRIKRLRGITSNRAANVINATGVMSHILLPVYTSSRNDENKFNIRGAVEVMPPYSHRKF